MADTCGTCIFFRGTNECHYSAPILGPSPFDRWPYTTADEWCGDGISTDSDSHRFSPKTETGLPVK